MEEYIEKLIMEAREKIGEHPKPSVRFYYIGRINGLATALQAFKDSNICTEEKSCATFIRGDCIQCTCDQFKSIIK